MKCKVCGEAPYVGKAKTKFRYRFNNYKSKHRAFRKGNRKTPQKRFHDHYCLDHHLGIDDWDFILFEQCETHEQLKEKETFWQHRLKTRIRQSVMMEFWLSSSFINFLIISLFKFMC